MKKILITAIIIVLSAAFAFADEYSDAEQAAVSAGVSRQLAGSMAARTRQRGYSPQSMNRIKSLFSRQYGSSATKVAEKVNEGIAKNVAENNVTAAAEKVQARYAVAEKISAMTQVSQKTAAKLTDIAADAMTAGAVEKSLEQTASALAAKKQERDEYAVAVMSFYREMVRYGVPDVKASSVAEKAMSKLSVMEINEYRSAFARGAGNANAGSMADAMGYNIGRGYGAGSMGGSGGGSGGAGGSGGGAGGSGGSGGSGGGHGGGGHR